MVFVGKAEDHATFSYFEYQVFMLLLATVICSSIATVDLVLNRFQVLPLLFPGVFSVRNRRFFFFTYDISDGVLGKRVRGQAKMLIRMNLCVVLSYLWQHCVLETTQTVGSEFPKKECEDDLDCFASKLHVDTFFTWITGKHQAIDCIGPQDDFPSRVVVSCIRFIPPSATTWLMHLAIAHSVSQLNFKAYEVMVWIAGNSVWIRRLLGVLIFVSLSVFVGLSLSGIMSEFVSSWLSFVMSLAVPVFFQVVWKTAKILDCIITAESENVRSCIQNNLDSAFRDIEQSVLNAEEADSNFKLSVSANMEVSKSGFSKMMGAKLMQRFVTGIRRPTFPSLLRIVRKDHDTSSEPCSPTLVTQQPCIGGMRPVDPDLFEENWALPDESSERFCLRERLHANYPDMEQRRQCTNQSRSKSTSPRSGYR